MATISPGAGAALTVVLGAATGFVTNLVTGEWSWTLGAGLVVLVAAAAALAWWDRTHGATSPRRTKVHQIVTGGSSISGGSITAHNGSEVTETAENSATIERSTIEADGSEVERKVDGGQVKDNRIIAD
ncbi:hypothetical protein [Streptomyces sp. NPDC056527]|uniref:hypothetical protein n=1 Tax=Streptomyces sp. NPDC056527 TaxID=3345853 RepID=UPI0036B6FEE5